MENKIYSHRDLMVWQKAMELVVAIYNLTNKFPREEIYGLSSQMRRAVVSIPSNIAEGKNVERERIIDSFLLLRTDLELNWRHKLK